MFWEISGQKNLAKEKHSKIQESNCAGVVFQYTRTPSQVLSVNLQKWLFLGLLAPCMMQLESLKIISFPLPIWYFQNTWQLVQDKLRVIIIR